LATLAKVTNGESFGHFGHGYLSMATLAMITSKFFPPQLSWVDTVGKFLQAISIVRFFMLAKIELISVINAANLSSHFFQNF